MTKERNDAICCQHGPIFLTSLYKAEVIWRQPAWPGVSAVEMATLRWVDWFNNRRLFGPISYIPPAETEANYYAVIEIIDRVA